MGTADINIDADADEPDLSEYFLSGTGVNVQTDASGGYMQWVNAGGRYHQNFVKDVQSGGFKLWVKGSSVNNQAGSNQGGPGVFCKVGGYWFSVFADRKSSPATTATITWRKDTFRTPYTVTAGDNAVSDQTWPTSPAGGSALIGLHFKSNGNVDVLYGNDSNVIGADVTTWTGDKITEFGFYNRIVAGVTSGSINDLFLSADIGTTLGGTITDPGFVETDVSSFIGTLGAGKGVVSEVNLSAMATHLANIGKYVNIFMSNGNIAFQGELRRLSQTDKHGLLYQFTQNSKKFNKLDCSVLGNNANPVVFAGIVRNLDFNDSSNVNTINDNNATFGDYVSKIAIFKLSKAKQKRYHPEFDTEVYLRSVDDESGAYIGTGTGTPVTPDDTDGAVNNLYFVNPDEPDDNSDLVLATANQWAAENEPSSPSASDNLGLECVFNSFLDSLDNIVSLDIKVICSFRRLSRYNDPLLIDVEYPRIMIFNYTTSEYETLIHLNPDNAGIGAFTIKANDDIFGYDETPNIDKTLTMTGETWADYFDQIEDNGATIQYQSKILVRSGWAKSITITGPHTVHVRKCEMEIEFDVAEGETQGHFPIGTQIGVTDIPLTTNATLTLKPSQAGYSAGDSYVIVPTVEDFVTVLYASIKADAGLIWDLDLNLTGADIWGISTNFSNKYFIFLLQQITADFNGLWWIDEDIANTKIYSVDVLTTSSLVIDYDDAMDGKIFFDIDGANISDIVKVIGKTSTITKAVTTTNLALGIESTIENDTSLIDLGAITKRADTLAVRKAAELNAFSIVLDIEAKDYSDVKKGNLFVCKLPYASDPYLIDDTLLCIGVERKKGLSTGSKEIFMAHFRKRFV